MPEKNRNHFLPLVAVVAGSLVYWTYLVLYTQMDIVWDADTFNECARFIEAHGFWPAYFEGKIRREPLFPLMIAGAIKLSHAVPLAYTQIMACFGAATLFLNQILVWKLLSGLKVRPAITAGTLIYLALSPAINNMAFSLFSEIAAAVWILPGIFAAIRWRKAIDEDSVTQSAMWGAVMGTLFTLATLTKGAFEVIYPLFLVLYLLPVFLKMWWSNRILVSFWSGLLASLVFFIAPIWAYKNMNLKYNGNFTITDRGAWTLYGSSARRTQFLTPRQWLTGLASVPGEGACIQLYGAKDCHFWSFRHGDSYGMGKMNDLLGKGLSVAQTNEQLIDLAKQEINKNPIQFTILTIMESVKLFFWESTQIGFVRYPAWLSHLYANGIFKNLLRLVVSVLTAVAVVWLWGRNLRGRDPLEMSIVGTFLFSFVLVYSFSLTLPRYSLPVAPLFLIAIAYLLNLLYNTRHGISR